MNLLINLSYFLKQNLLTKAKKTYIKGGT